MSVAGDEARFGLVAASLEALLEHVPPGVPRRLLHMFVLNFNCVRHYTDQPVCDVVVQMEKDLTFLQKSCRNYANFYPKFCAACSQLHSAAKNNLVVVSFAWQCIRHASTSGSNPLQALLTVFGGVGSDSTEMMLKVARLAADSLSAFDLPMLTLLRFKDTDIEAKDAEGKNALNLLLGTVKPKINDFQKAVVDVYVQAGKTHLFQDPDNNGNTCLDNLLLAALARGTTWNKQFRENQVSRMNWLFKVPGVTPTVKLAWDACMHAIDKDGFPGIALNFASEILSKLESRVVECTKGGVPILTKVAGSPESPAQQALLSKLLSLYDIDVNTIGPDGTVPTPLMMAVNGPFLETAKALLKTPMCNPHQPTREPCSQNIVEPLVTFITSEKISDDEKWKLMFFMGRNCPRFRPNQWSTMPGSGGTVVVEFSALTMLQHDTQNGALHAPSKTTQALIALGPDMISPLFRRVAEKEGVDLSWLPIDASKEVIVLNLPDHQVRKAALLYLFRNTSASFKETPLNLNPEQLVLYKHLTAVWSPTTHKFHHYKYRSAVCAVMLVYCRQCALHNQAEEARHKRQRRDENQNDDFLPELPIELWFKFFEYVNRSDWELTAKPISGKVNFVW